MEKCQSAGGARGCKLPTGADRPELFHPYSDNSPSPYSTTGRTITYLDGEEIVVRYVTGRYISQAGYLTTVVKAYGHGAILELSDGTLLSVPEYDRYDTGWWLPPYKALLTANRLDLYNLEKVKCVWVTPVR